MTKAVSKDCGRREVTVATVICFLLRMTAASHNFASKLKILIRMDQFSSGTHSNENFYKKSNKSAVVIIPPDDLWEQIQNIRRIHDRAYERWMPHINLLYPFLEDDPGGQCFSDAAETLAPMLTQVKQFKVTFDKNSFRCFHHSKKCTLWLKPEENATLDSFDDGKHDLTDYSAVHKDVAELQCQLEDLFPHCDDLRNISGSFTPHLSLGQFSVRELEKYVKEIRSSWQPISFLVREIHLISRRSFEAPFEIRKTIPLSPSLA